MIAKNRAQLKTWIKNMSAKVDVNENIILQNYMLERLLERISVSKYKYKFVLKGGMLITAIVGIDMRNTLDMDITTGDVITPKEIKYKFDLMFENRSIEILAYNMETVIADKFETIISRNVDTTRARDFYDIYILWTTQQKNFDKKLLKQAIIKKFEYRETSDKLNNIDEIMKVIEESDALKEHWKNYQSKFSYAENISYEDAMKVLDEINLILKN